jgi:putative addiction module component (TIGR02574 family)
MTTADRLFEEAMQLPPVERERLAARLWDSVECDLPGHPIEDWDYWGPELERRNAAMESGADPGVSVDDAIAAARAAIRARTGH